MTGPQIGAALEAAAVVRSLAPHLPIVWGGVHPTLLPRETLEHELVDIVVVGDGEETFVELVDTLRNGGDLHNVRGIVFKEGDGQIRTAPRPPFGLQKIPEAAFALVDLHLYHALPVISERWCLPIVTSRGCPFHCGFCYNVRFHGRRWTALRQQTVSWIAALRARFGISDFILLDDNFFVDLKRVTAICQLLAAGGIKVGIHNANCRVDTLLKMDDGLLGLLRDTGFNRMFVGVESGSNRILERINKGINVNQVLEANQRLRRAGIDPYYGFMAGFPGETVEDLKGTLNLMNRLIAENPAAVVSRLQFYTPFPGTNLAEEARAQGLPAPASLLEWTEYHYDRLHFPVSDKAHGRFLNDIHFYSRFLDPKLVADDGRWRKQLIGLFSSILRTRIRCNCYSFMIEPRLNAIVAEKQSDVQTSRRGHAAA